MFFPPALRHLILQAALAVMPLMCAAVDTVQVNFASTGKAMTLRGNGLLNSLEPEYIQTPNALIDPLKVTLFRDPFRGNGNLVATSARAAALGAKFEVVMSHNFDYDPAAQTFTAFRDAFAARCLSATQYVRDNNNGRVVQWDVWNEADLFWPNTADPSGEYLATYQAGVDAIRSVDASAIIVGPSLADYGSDYNKVTMSQFLDYAKANNALPNILSWHEFNFNSSGGSQFIVANVAAARTLMTTKGISIPAINLNEMLGPSEQFNPGVLAHYFGNLDRAGAGAGVHSTWQEPSGAQNENGNVLAGLLTPDPRPLGSTDPDPRQRRSTWWVYERYARLTGEVATVTVTTAVGKRENGIASKDTGVARLLLGRTSIANDGTVAVTFSNLDQVNGLIFNNKVRVLAELITDSGEAASAGPVTKINAHYALSSNALTLTLGTASLPFGATDGYFITLSVVPALPAWRTLHGLPTDGSQDLAKPAGDGVANVHKYAFNMAPNAGDLARPNVQVLPVNGTTGLPRISVDAQGRLVIEFARRKSASNPGITYSVETGGVLTSLLLLDLSAATIVSIDMIGERVTVTDPVISGQRFSRVRVTIP